MTTHRANSEDEATMDPPATGDGATVPPWLVQGDLDPARVRKHFVGVTVTEGVHALSGLEVGRASLVVSLLPPEHAAAVLEQLERTRAADILSNMASDERADLLAAIEPTARGEIADALPAALKAEAARLLRYPPDSAGGLMHTELLKKPASATVREVIRDLRANQERYAALSVQYLYLVDEAERLVGVAPMRDLLLAPEDARIETLAYLRPISVTDTTTTQELADLLDAHPFQGVPVVDATGVLLGVVSKADVSESEHHQSEEQYRRSQGIVGGEELRSMPLSVRVRRRGAWLGINLVLCLGGAGVIAAFQGTLASAIVVAAVLPVISATSGNAAMQAAAVSVRELTLDVIEANSWRRVLAHELALAIVLAFPLGAAVAGLAMMWGANWAIGAAVGAAMLVNAAFSVTLGALCPLVLRRFGIDPALASGPVTTTLADMSGFALTLALVTWVA